MSFKIGQLYYFDDKRFLFVCLSIDKDIVTLYSMLHEQVYSHHINKYIYYKVQTPHE